MKFESFNELEQWLEIEGFQKSREIAARAAFRALPVLEATRHVPIGSQSGEQILLQCFRATLLCRIIVAKWQEPGFPLNAQAQDCASKLDALSTVLSLRDPRPSQPPLFSQASISDNPTINAVNAIRSAIKCMLYRHPGQVVGLRPSAQATSSLYLSTVARSDTEDYRSLVHQELEVASTIQDDGSFAYAFWPKNFVEGQEIGIWKDFQSAPADKKSWTFWADWIVKELSGKPIDRKLQLRVASINNHNWEMGVEAIAEEIERIEAEHLSKKLPLAEEITFNSDTGKFSVAPIAVENAPLMAALMARISDEYEDALSGHNGLSETSGDGRRIQRATTRYANNPQQAELTLTTVAKSLRRQIHQTSELPDSPDNIALLEAVEDGVRGIRANHPEVAANREQLAQQALREIAPEDREMLEKAAPVLSAISEDDLAKDFADDIPELINDALLPLPSRAPPLPGADASTRIFSRVSKMRTKMPSPKDITKKGAQVFDSDTIKTLRLLGFVGGAGAGAVYFVLKHLDTIVQIGLRVVGVL